MELHYEGYTLVFGKLLIYSILSLRAVQPDFEYQIQQKAIASGTSRDPLQPMEGCLTVRL